MAENLPNPSTRKEMFLASAAGANVDTPAPITREEIFLDAIANNSGGGGEGGTTNYNQLTNKPKINGTELSGNTSLDDIGVTSAITEEVAKIVADAPEDFDTLKEMSDWITEHEDSAAAMNSAIQANTAAISAKVDKVSGKDLSTNDYTTAEKTKLAGLENYDDSAVKSDIALNRQTLGSTSKNLLKINSKSLTAPGFVVPDNTKMILSEGNYIISLFSDKNAQMKAVFSSDNEDVKTIDDAIRAGKNEFTFSLSEKTTKLRMFVNAPCQLSEIMIRSADIEDDTFEPYRQSLQTQIGKLVDKGAKNLLKITATSQTINGVTYTINGDGTITANGTATSVAVLSIANNVDFKYGQVLTGCPTGGSGSSYALYIRSTKFYDYGSSVVITENTTHTAAVVVYAGYTANNVVFHPMLCTAEDYEASPEFVPYCPTMQELYQRILALENKS